MDHGTHGNNYRPDIDGLRALAILLVVAFHGFPAAFKGGFIGVDVFFVISGFLITRIIIESLRRSSFSFVEFYGRRIRRIFPALALVLGTCVVIGWFALLPEEYEQLGRHVVASAAFLQNFALADEAGYFDTASELKPLMHIWSLAIEEQFYAVFPALLWLAWRLGLSLLTVTVGLGLLSFGANIATVYTDPLTAFYMPYTRFWELMAGASLASFTFKHRPANDSALCLRSAVLRRLRSPGFQNLCSVIGIGLILLAALAIHQGKLFPGWWATAPVLGTLMLIASGPSAWVNRKILSARWMVYLGLISYPLYLWHWPLLSFAKIVQSGPLSTPLVLTAIAISLLLSWLTYEVLEKKVRSRASRGPQIAAFSAVIAGTALFGLATAHQNGWEERPPVRLLQEQMQQFQFARNRDAQCDAEFPEYRSAYCFKSGAGKADVVLIGDSHSNMLYYGLADVLQKSHRIIANFGQTACLPLHDVTTRQRGTVDRCVETMNRALYAAATDGNVRTVILSSRGPLYITGKGYGTVPAETLLDFEIALADREGHLDPPVVFEIGLRNTVRILEEAGKRVIVVLDVPELGFDPKSCVSRPLRTSINRDCRLPYGDYLKRNETYRRIVHKVVNEFNQARVFDASSLFCDDVWCNVIIAGRMMYRDGDHPSLHGSALIAEQLLGLIK